jgi:hypothetical protein
MQHYRFLLSTLAIFISTVFAELLLPSSTNTTEPHFGRILNYSTSEGQLDPLDNLILQDIPHYHLKLDKTSESRCPIYTYFEEIARLPAWRHRMVLRVWARHWYSLGFMPIILGRKEAQAHPFYKPFYAKMAELPSVNPQAFELACYLRWLAFVQVGGGIMIDYDAIYFGKFGKEKPFTCIQQCGKNEPVGPRNSFFPMLAFGHAKLLTEKVIQVLYDVKASDFSIEVSRQPTTTFEKPVQNPHVSDMVILRKPQLLAKLAASRCVSHLIHVNTDLTLHFDYASRKKSSVIKTMLLARFLYDRTVILIDSFPLFSKSYQICASCEREFIQILFSHLTGTALSTSTPFAAQSLRSDIFEVLYKLHSFFPKGIRNTFNSHLDFAKEISTNFLSHFQAMSTYQPWPYPPGANRSSSNLPFHDSFYFYFVEDPLVLIYDQWHQFFNTHLSGGKKLTFKAFLQSPDFLQNYQTSKILNLHTLPQVEAFFNAHNIFIGLLPNLSHSLTALEYQIGVDLSGRFQEDKPFPNLSLQQNLFRTRASAFFQKLFQRDPSLSDLIYRLNKLDFSLFHAAQTPIEQNLETCFHQ